MVQCKGLVSTLNLQNTKWLRWQRHNGLIFLRLRVQTFFREDKSNNAFREILKCFRKTAKFEFSVKQIIYLASPDHPLQNDI